MINVSIRKSEAVSNFFMFPCVGGKKKQLLLDKPDDDSVVNAGYDGYDDFDFM